MSDQVLRNRWYGRWPRDHGVRWLLGLRLVLVSILLVVPLQSCGWRISECSVLALGLALGTSIALGVSGWWWCTRLNYSRWFEYAQLVLDVLAVTVLIYLSGGPISPFLFLYLPLAMAAAMLRSRQEGLIVAMGCVLAYAALANALIMGAVPMAIAGMQPVLPSSGLMVQILGLLCAMALISVATNYLVHKLNATRELVVSSQDAISELQHKERALLEGVPSGVITTDLTEAITSINQAAESLLALTCDQAVGRPLHQLVAGLPAGLSDGTSDRKDVTLENSGRAPLHLVVETRPLFDANGTRVGSMIMLHDVTRLRTAEEQLQVQERMARLLSDSQVGAGKGVEFSELVGESPVMKQVFKLVERVANTDATVLITGESGTGKELAAKAIHAGSNRARGPFVAVNCGAIPENLLESELFGHKKGAFTGAERDSLGLFRQAEGGTIFLDEIGELPLHMQTKLLRVLQERSVHPVGGERDVPINVRILSATNRNLKDEVAAGRFREDLYYRINVVSIKLPAVRQRREDLPLLINSLLRRLVVNGQQPVVSPQAMQIMLAYDYPGNVRELENMLERAVVLGGSVILPEHLPDAVREPAPARPTQQATQIIVDESIEFPVNLDQILDRIERRYLEAALSETQGAKKRAAELLGINFRSLRYRLQKYDLG